MSSSLALVGLLLVSAATPPADQASRLTLTGTVKARAGAPVKGATVFVRTASPREGTSSTCPSCYLDCGKKAPSDGKGEFRIEALDPKLRFDLLVVARGYKAQIVARVDPRGGAQAIALDPFDLTGIPPDRLVRGQFTRAGGRPVVGAVVEVRGVRRGDTTHYGGDLGVDPVAVTDERGEFVLVADKPVSEVQVVVDGPGLARRPVSFAASHIELTAGVTVTGRLLSGGKPMASMAMGLVSSDRDSDKFVGAYEVSTGADGRFTFLNIPPHLAFHLYGKMESFGTQGLPVTTSRTTGDDGSTMNVGDVTVAPGRRLSGRLVLADGKPPPTGTRLGLYRQGPWDHIEVTLPSDGHFQLAGLPAESVSLNVHVPGYRFSFDNPSVNWRYRGIEGRIDRDIDDLVLVMEPGESGSYSSRDKPPPGFDDSDPSERPLRSAKLPAGAAALAR